tara:strand:- start:1055 stop:1609 length:555 start_codon:yes stop_codon:yes gene_type:complete
MIKKILGIVVLSLLLSGNSFAIENWEIKKAIDNEYIEISTEGLKIKGDKYKLLIKVNGECDTIEDGFTFYTAKNNPGVMLLPGKKIKIESMGHTIVSEIVAVVPVLNGSDHLVWISNGAYELDGHTKFISESKKNDVKLLVVFDNFEKRTGWEAKEFFDITENSWSLKNVSEAVKQGRKMCLGN